MMKAERIAHMSLGWEVITDNLLNIMWLHLSTACLYIIFN